MRAPSDRDGHRWGLRLACLALVSLATAAARPARASGHLPPMGGVYTLGIPALILPSEVGATLTADPHFLLGWSWQIPLGETQRFVGGVSWLPDADGRHVQGRLGYRFAPGRVFGGLGISIDNAGVTWSPELGVNLVPIQDISKSGGVHLLLRGEIAPGLNQFRGGSLLLGWTIL